MEQEPLTALQQQILDHAADFLFSDAGLESHGNIRLGEILLKYPVAREQEITREIEFLSNAGCLEIHGLPPHENLRLTPTGLLLCRNTGECAVIANRVLAYIKGRMQAEGFRFKEYTWADLRAANIVTSDERFPLVLNLVQCLDLWSGGSSGKNTAHFRVPSDMLAFRQFSDCRDLYTRIESRRRQYGIPPSRFEWLVKQRLDSFAVSSVDMANTTVEVDPYRRAPDGVGLPLKEPTLHRGGDIGISPPPEGNGAAHELTMSPSMLASGEPVVRILHLSDFHFRATTAWDAEPVLGRLAADIARLAGSGLAPDLIVITGDIAFSGKAKEYELAADWMRERLLPAAGAQPGQLFLVPGNHDVDRDLVDVVARHAAQGLLNESQQQDVAALLGGESGTVFLRRHRAFIEFVNRFGGSGAPQHRPWHALTREIRGIRVHLAGFSSTWLASGDDRGRLLLGLWQCNELLRGADDAEIVIAAMHHPWDYLAEWDHVSRAEIERSASLVLRGHLHDTRHTFTQSTHHGGVLELAAGACYENSRWPNSYHLVELFPRSGRARIHPRYWDAHRRDWQPDHNLFGKTAAEMPLRVRQTPEKRSPYLDTAQIRELVFREAVQDAIQARKNGDFSRALIYLAGLYEAMRICWTRAERQLQGEDMRYEDLLPAFLSTPAGATFRQHPRLYSEPTRWHEGHGSTADPSMGFDPAALMRIRRLVALAEQILAGSKNAEAQVRPEDIDFLLQTVPRQLVLLEQHSPDIFQVLAPS